MGKMTTTAARKDFSDTVDRVQHHGERIEVYRRGKGVAGIVPFDDLKLLEALEDRMLSEMAKKALREKGRIPWSKIKKDLGL